MGVVSAHVRSVTVALLSPTDERVVLTGHVDGSIRTEVSNYYSKWGQQLIEHGRCIVSTKPIQSQNPRSNR